MRAINLSKIVISTTIFLFVYVFHTPLFAESQNILIIGNPTSGEISGSENGSNLSFETYFDISLIPQNADIISAQLEYSQTNLSPGLIRFIDKYSADVIDAKLLNGNIDLSVNNILVYVTQWQKNPSQNLGILIQGSALQPEDKISIRSLILNITYAMPDTVEPIILEIRTEDILSESAKIIVITDEETQVKINYGKTSLYGSELIPLENLFTLEHTLILDNLLSGQTYHFNVEVADRYGNTTISENRVINTLKDFEPNNSSPINYSLTPPTGLKADIRNDDGFYTINLSWTPASEAGVRGYLIYRATDDNKEYTEYASVDNQSNTFIDENIQPDKTYYYYIRSFTANQISPKSAEIASKVVLVEDAKPVEPATLQTFLLTLALASILLFMLYIVIKVFTNIEKNKSKKLINVLKDPDFYK